MDYQGKAESGLHLLARLSARPSLRGLDDVLFPEGPNAKDVIDVIGDLSSGKTILFTQFLAKCLLPQNYQEFQIGGLGVGAILIDTDHHFNLLKLVNLMEFQLVKFKSNSSLTSGLNSTTIEIIIKECLANLIILQCFDSSQLLTTFHSLPKLLAANTKVSLILVDSISAYYWQDTASGGIRKMDLYLKRVLETLQKSVQEYKVVICYTRPMYFQSKVKDHRDNVGNYKIFLQRQDIQGLTELTAEVISENCKVSLEYHINAGGLRWSPKQAVQSMRHTDSKDHNL